MTGKGTTADGGVAEVVADNITIEGANDAVSVTRLPNVTGIPATMLQVTAVAPGAVTITLQQDQAKLLHVVRVVSPADVTQVSLRTARTTPDVSAWGWSAKTIDQTATLEGPLTTQVALVGTTRDGVEVLGNAQALQFHVTRSGTLEPTTPELDSPRRLFTQGEFSNWAAPLETAGASSFTVSGSLGTASAEVTVALP